MDKRCKTNVPRPKDKKEVEDCFLASNLLYEKDAKKQDFTIDEDWDEDFRTAMLGLDEKTQKARKLHRTLLNIAASIVLLLIVGLGATQKETIGECLKKVFSNEVKTKDAKFDHLGTKEELTIAEEEEQTIFYYDDATLTEMYAKVRDKLKRPMFQIADGGFEYELEDAVYDVETKLFSFRLVTEEGKIFVSQREVLDNGGLGVKNDADGTDVWNEQLQREILIYRSLQDDCYTFAVQVEYSVFIFCGYVSEEMCCEIAENLSFG